MDKNRIIWITGDYFIDVDFMLVPYLKEHYDINIDWVVIKGYNSNISIDSTLDCKLYELKHSFRDFRLINDFKKIFDEVELRNADLIYSNYVGVPTYYPYLFFYTRMRVPIVHAAHNVIPYAVWPKKLTWYVNFIFRLNKHFQLFSKFTAEYFQNKYPHKSYFYCPMTLKGYGKVTTNNYHLDTNKVNLLFFGNVMDNKRLDLLIDAVKSLPEDLADRVHLSICGNCKTPEKYIPQIGNAKNISVHFKRIDDCEVAELFSKHSYLVLPYEAVAQSGPHMIAYYYNLPVIASDIEGFAERVENGKNGFLFKVNDKEDLIKAIKQVANMSEEQYLSIKENLNDYSSEHFSLENISQKYINYFQTIFKS